MLGEAPSAAKPLRVALADLGLKHLFIVQGCSFP